MYCIWIQVAIQRKVYRLIIRKEDELPLEAQRTFIRRGYDIVSAIRNSRLNDKLRNDSRVNWYRPLGK